MKNNEIFKTITDKFAEALRQGVLPWRQKWLAMEKAYNNKSNEDYNLLNQLLLGKGGAWATMKQWNEQKTADGKAVKVKKGEHPSYIVQKWLDVVDADGKFQVEPIKTAVLKLAKYKVNETVEYNGINYTVRLTLKWVALFHVDQTNGGKAVRKAKKLGSVPSREAKADKTYKSYAKKQKIKVSEGSNEAFYQPATDSITVPAIEQYTDMADYYSTLFHELVHSTGAKNRLNRQIENKFGTKAYAKEELIAEMGSAFILSQLGIETKDTFDNSAAYIQAWLEALENDIKFVYNACAGAEKASNFIMA